MVKKISRALSEGLPIGQSRRRRGAVEVKLRPEVTNRAFDLVPDDEIVTRASPPHLQLISHRSVANTLENLERDSGARIEVIVQTHTPRASTKLRQTRNR